jgi:colanic acid biosynthesis glycosyl transferase WcaI
MHVLLLSQIFPPETGSAAAKMEEMAHYLRGQGHQVSVVSQVPCYPAGVVYPGYEGAWFRREARDGLRISRTWSYASPERRRLRPRLFNYLSFMTTALAGILAGPRPDIILVYSPPLFLGLTATLAGKLCRCPFVFWVNDLWLRAARAYGFLPSPSLYRLGSLYERFIYRQAGRIMVYSPEMLEEVVADGGRREKIECHPLWIDTDIFHPDPAGASRVRKKYGWGNRFVVLFGGNIGLAQGLEVLLEAARRLKDQAGIHFVLVGSGIEKERLAQMACDQGLTNVEFIGHQPKEEVGAFFSAAEVLFAHLKAAPHRVGTVPEKILAYMACGRPVLLAVQEGAAADIIRRYDCGEVVPPDNPEALVQAILSLYGNRRQLHQAGLKGRLATEAYFAGPKVLQAMVASLADLVRR